MLRAVCFDWGETLVTFEWDDDLLAEGHRRGLAAIGRDDDPAAVTERFRREWAERLRAPGAAERHPYADVLRDLLGPSLLEHEAERFQEAEWEAWRPARRLAATTHALLESLRRRGLLLAVVADAWPEPGELKLRELVELGVYERIDTAVFSTDVGARKPDPAIFRRALDELGVPPGDVLFVGDRLEQDVAGAAAVGMHTAQALWFRADEGRDGIEPEFRAFTQMDVLNAVDRLRR